MELRLQATLRGGVDGDVRRMSPSEALSADSKVVIVGASLAGWRAVETLRAEGYAGSIVLVGEERHLPYDRPPLSKQILAGTWPPEKAVLADSRRASEHRVEEVLGRRAVHLDAAARKLELDDGTVLQGDGLVIATGASPRPLPGTDDLMQRDGLFTLRTLDDSLALRAAVTAVDQARVVVIGAGFIGAEVASTCADLGCRVTVLEALDVPLRNVLGHMIGSHFGSLHESHGVHLRTGVSIDGVRRAVSEETGRLVVELDGGEFIPADVVVVGIGVLPATGWLADSGLTIDNGVVCDEHLFAADDIVAAGDIARWQWRRDGDVEQIRIEHWQVAAEAGVAAAAACWQAGRMHPPSRPCRISGPISTAFGSRCWGARAAATRSTLPTGPPRKASSWRCSGGRGACGRSWPSASRASSWDSGLCSRRAAAGTLPSLTRPDSPKRIRATRP